MHDKITGIVQGQNRNHEIAGKSISNFVKYAYNIKIVNLIFTIMVHLRKLCINQESFLNNFIM